MRDDQIELIAALVEGRLKDESEARALIDSSPVFREEYEAQKTAFEMLRQVGTASLSDGERSALHRDVWTSLRQGTATSPGGGSWYYRWVAVAAGLFVVVGLAAVLGQVGGEGDSGGDETFAEMAADQDGSAITTAAATEDDAAGADRPEESAEADTMSDAAATTLAGSESSAPADGDVAAFYAGEAEKVRSGQFEGRLQAPDESDSEVAACVTDAGLEGHRAVATLLAPPGIAGEDDTRLAVAVPDESELADAAVVFVDASTCEVVYTDE